MNLDDIKKDWDQGEVKTLEINDLDQLGKAKSPLGSIKRNLLFESIVALIAAVLILIAMIYSDAKPLTYVTALVTVLIALVNIVLFVVFALRFYRKMSNLDLSQSSSLRDFIFQSRLSIELYRAYNFTLMPLALILGITISSNNIVDHIYDAFQAGTARTWSVFAGIIVYLVILLGGYWFTNYWANAAYGKHVDALDEIQKELN